MSERFLVVYSGVCTGGAGRLEYFRNVVSLPDARKTTLTWSFDAFGKSELWVALITFLYLDFLDATGTLYSMASLINNRVPGEACAPATVGCQ